MAFELTVKGRHNEYGFEPVGELQQKPTYTVHLKKEDDGFVITCPELNATTQGDTQDEATKNIIEAIQLVLETENKKNDFNVYVIKS